MPLVASAAGVAHGDRERVADVAGVENTGAGIGHADGQIGPGDGVSAGTSTLAMGEPMPVAMS